MSKNWKVVSVWAAAENGEVLQVRPIVWGGAGLFSCIWPWQCCKLWCRCRNKMTHNRRGKKSLQRQQKRSVTFFISCFCKKQFFLVEIWNCDKPALVGKLSSCMVWLLWQCQWKHECNSLSNKLRVKQSISPVCLFQEFQLRTVFVFYFFCLFCLYSPVGFPSNSTDVKCLWGMVTTLKEHSRNWLPNTEEVCSGRPRHPCLRLKKGCGKVEC